VGWQPTARREPSRVTHPGAGRPGCYIRPDASPQRPSPGTLECLAGHRRATSSPVLAERRSPRALERARPSGAVPPWGQLIHSSRASVAHARARPLPNDEGAHREAPRGARATEHTNNGSRNTYPEQLLKIESKPPTITVTDTANPTTLAIHLLRVKTAAAQHGFLDLLLDSRSTHTPSTNVAIVRRWIIESFECPNIRSRNHFGL